MRIKKVISICIIIITIFVTASFNSVKADDVVNDHLHDFSTISSLDSKYSCGTLFWTEDTKPIMTENIAYRYTKFDDFEKYAENEENKDMNGNGKKGFAFETYYKLNNNYTGFIEFLLTNCSIDKDGDMCDVLIRVQNIGQLGGDTAPNAWIKLEVTDYGQEVYNRVEKENGLINFYLHGNYAQAEFDMIYYKAGQYDSKDVSKGRANVPGVAGTLYGFDLPDSIGNEGLIMRKERGHIYYDTNGNLKPSDRIDNNLNVGIMCDTPGETNGVTKSNSVVITQDLVDSTFGMTYIGAGCNIGYVFISPYTFETPEPIKNVSKKRVYEEEKFQYTITQHVPNNFYKLDFLDNKTGKYSEFRIEDTLEKNLTFNSKDEVKIKNESGTDVTDWFNISFNYGKGEFTKITAELKDSYKNNSNFYNHTYKITIPVFVQKGTGLKTDTISNQAFTYTENDNGERDRESNTVDVSLKYKITYKAGIDHGTIDSLNGQKNPISSKNFGSTSTCNHGTNKSATVVFQVEDNYELVKVTDNGTEIPLESLICPTTGVYQFSITDEDIKQDIEHEIVITTIPKYKITYKAEINHGTILNLPQSVVCVEGSNITRSVIFQVANGYKISKVTLDGKEISIEDLIKPSIGVYQYNISDTNINQNKEHNIVITTEPKDATLVVKYEDENGNTLAKTETTTKKFFDEYTTNAKQITGYKLKETPENATGTMTEESITVTYVYQPYSAKVEVTKMDNNTGKIITKENTTFALYEWQSSTNTWVAPTHINASTVNGTVSDGKGAILKEKTSGTKGTYTASMYYDIQNQGKFRIVEYTRPWGYTTTNWTREIQISQDNQIFTSQVKNTQVRGQINFKKNDAQVNYNNSSYGENYAQGDATLQGASYGVYAKENIISPDNGAVVYRAGQQVMTGMTDANGKITWSNLYLGKYYIQEITASTGYLKDSTQYEVDLKTYYQNNYYNRGNQTTANVIYQNTTTDAQYANSDKRIISKETIKKQRFQLTKLSLSEDSTMANPLQGAGFKIYLIKDLSAVKNGTIKPNANGSYNAVDFKTIDFTKEQTALDFSSNTNGIRIPELFSNEDGIVTSPELPYGKYVVIESTIPEGMQAIQPFIVDIYEDSRNPKKMIYPIDREFEARIRVIKKDATTGMPVLKASAAYRIWNITQNEYVEQWVTYPNKIQYGTESNPYRTTEEGYLLTPERLGMGEYELREVEAPEGYVIAGKEENPKPNVRFSINTNIVYEMDPDLGAQNAIISVEQENMPQLGTITVSKSGEFLSSSQEQENQYQFDYNQRPVTDAKFAIYAKEDIYTQDNQTDENGERIKIYVKNQFVTEVETNTEGKAIFERLPLGEYSIVETKAGEGFTLNTERKEVSLTYEGQDKAIIYRATEYVNERQKVSINIHKIDADTGESISGAEFGLYTEEVITYMDNSGATQTIPEGKLVLKATSGEDGIASFQDENLPLGKYYIKELQAPRGYVTSLERMDVDCSYASQEIDKIVRELEFTNTMIKVKIRVTDYETGANLTNTQVVIRDENGNDLGTYITDNNGEIKVKGFEAEKKYSVEEVKAKNGYVKDLLFTNDTEDENELIKSKGANGLVIFKVKDSEELQIVTVNNKAKVAQLEIQKTGDVLIGTKYETQRIDTARLAVYTKEDIVHPDGKQGVILPKGTKIAEGQTQDGIITIEKLSEELIKAQTEVVQLLLERGLPLGEYEIKELEAPEGYELEEQPKSVSLQSGDDNQEIEKITVEFYNKRIGTPEDPPGDNPGGDNPGGGDTPGDNPGGGDSPGDNPGSGDSPGDNPGGGDTPGDNPGSGDMPEDNAGGGDTSGGTSGGGNSLNGGSNNKDGNNASNSANKTNSEAKSADMATKFLPKTGTEILPIIILIVSILTLVLIEIKLMKRRKS